MAFQKATKKEAKLRLALIGPSGSGKTYTALTLATHLVPNGKIAVIDTERGSASKYADLFNFDVQELETFHPKQYINAIAEAEAAGYDVLVIDSLSHAWMGRDGALELVDKAARRNGNGNSWAAWRDVTPLHNALVDAMLAASLHVIVTMRSKMEYVQDKDEKGKSVIRKIGLQPVQRDGLEYEFDVIGDMDQDNTLIVSKTRCPSLVGAVISRPNADLATVLAQWLRAEPGTLAEQVTQPTTEHASTEQCIFAGPAKMATTPSTLVPVTGSGAGNGVPHNGHGPKGAAVRTGKWAEAAKALIERYPCYAKDNGQPDWYLLIETAAACNFSEITDANLEQVVQTLAAQAATSK
jgi:energy-coupling factor transporter ATP-binding protein EcfA2